MEERKCRVRVDGETREYPAGTTYQAIAEDYQARYEHQIVLVFAGQNHLQELRKRVEKDCEIRFVTTGDAIGHATYKRSMCFLLVKRFMMWQATTKSNGCAYIFRWTRDITALWKAA